MLSLSLVIQIVVSGILMGGIYSFVALGLTLIFGVMKVINFAHGALLMLGMYISYWIFIIFKIDPLSLDPYQRSLILWNRLAYSAVSN